jgi:hypothetical protein
MMVERHIDSVILVVNFFIRATEKRRQDAEVGGWIDKKYHGRFEGQGAGG